MINTWFYNTVLKDYPELQKTLTSKQETNLQVKSLVLSGSVGIGKTHNSILLAKKYYQNKIEQEGYWHYSFEPYFITFLGYLDLLKNKSFGNPIEKDEAYYKFKDIQDAPFLIIDDLRSSFGSKYEASVVDNALLELLSLFWASRETKTLIVTTNNSYDEIQSSFSSAVCSRLFGICEYTEVVGTDKRMKQNV